MMMGWAKVRTDPMIEVYTLVTVSEEPRWWWL